MYGFMVGVTDNDDISYCPKCGTEIKTFDAEGLSCVTNAVIISG